MTERPEKSTRQEMEGPGVQLRRARERRGLSLHDVAQELHLDEWMLQALEEDDFAALGAPVFTKGHMRQYGSMLGLNTDDLMIAYYRKRGRDDSPPPITRMMAPESPSPRISWHGLIGLSLVLIVIIVVLLVWVFLTRDGAPQTSAPAPAPAVTPQDLPVEEPPDAASGAVAPPVAAVEPAAAGSEEPGAADAGEQPAVADEAVAAPPPAEVAEDIAATAEPIEVRLTLSGESWVEVTDSDGNRLIYAMLAAGRRRTVSGTPPIEVFLGLSSVVRVDVNGQFYPIPRSAIRGNTARFVIDADGR